MHALALQLRLQHLDLDLEIELVVLLEDLFLLGEDLLDRGQDPAEVLRQRRVVEIALLRRILAYNVAGAVEIGDEEAPGARQILRVLLELRQDRVRACWPIRSSRVLSSRECRPWKPHPRSPRTLRCASSSASITSLLVDPGALGGGLDRGPIGARDPDHR